MSPYKSETCGRLSAVVVRTGTLEACVW